MFAEYDEFYLQKDMNFKSRGKRYTLFSGKKLIGTLVEKTTTSRNIGNQLLKLTSLFRFVSLELKVVDKEENVLGTIRKERGFYKDFLLSSKDGKHIATIQPTLKVKSPKMTVVDGEGNRMIEAIGGYGATDFSVFDCSKDKQISTIKRRSRVYSTVKETLLNDDGYYVDNTENNPLITFSLLAMGIVLDVYFFDR